MPFDPALPVADSVISSAELRNQFNGLKTIIDSIPAGATVDQLNDVVNMLSQDMNAIADNLGVQLADTARNPVNVSPLSLTISDPPTQAEVQAIALRLDDLIGNLQRP